MKSLTVLIFCTVLAMSAGYKILGIMPVPGRSHYYPFAALMKGLARKGHDITFISYFKEKGPPSNYREITLKLDDSKRSLSELFSFEDLKKLFGDSDTDTFFFKLFNVFALDEMAERTCMVDIHSEVIRKFANEKQTFDAVIVEAFHSDCFMGFAHLYGAPLIKFTASLPFPWYNWRLGQPSNPSYVQNVMSGFSAPLTFSQRLQNTVFDIFHRFYIECVRDPTHYEAAKKFYPDGTPGLYEISSNASLSLVNTHYTYLGSKPLNPNVVEVGGIHVTLNKPQPVPKVRFSP